MAETSSGSVASESATPRSNVATRSLGQIGAPVIGTVTHVSGVAYLFVLTVYFTFVGPFRGQTKIRKQLFALMSSVGVKSVPIVGLVSFLIGAVLVLQTGAVMKEFGQLERVPGMVGLSITRELGPLMTAIVLTARVGASFTAVLASMRINDEIMALETMAVHPVGYLVVPRFVSLVVMQPCLTVFSYLIGMVGGWLVSYAMFDISTEVYVSRTIEALRLAELNRGLFKSVVFSVITSLVCCYFGFITEGGPVGLGRNTMVAVVTSLVLIIVADALITAVIVGYLQ